MRAVESTHTVSAKGEKKRLLGWMAISFPASMRIESLRIAMGFLYDRGANEGPMATKKPPREGSLIVAVLIVLGLVFAGHWIVTYVKNSNPWALIPWYGGIAAFIILFGLFTNLRRN